MLISCTYNTFLLTSNNLFKPPDFLNPLDISWSVNAKRMLLVHDFQICVFGLCSYRNTRFQARQSLPNTDTQQPLPLRHSERACHMPQGHSHLDLQTWKPHAIIPSLQRRKWTSACWTEHPSIAFLKFKSGLASKQKELVRSIHRDCFTQTRGYMSLLPRGTQTSPVFLCAC